MRIGNWEPLCGGWEVRIDFRLTHYLASVRSADSYLRAFGLYSQSVIGCYATPDAAKEGTLACVSMMNEKRIATLDDIDAVRRKRRAKG